MLHCAQCFDTTSTEEVCDHCGESPLLAEQYALREVVGEGAHGVTFRAVSKDGEVFAVKQLLLRRVSSWKRLEQMQREAQTLESIDHPNIPRYHDDFSVDSGPAVTFYLVQEFVEGKSLESLGRLSIDRAVPIVAQLLDVLADLHALPVPVIHRDVKPSNVILRDAGDIALVDFGSVRSAAQHGSTIAGTFGYMAPEQFSGEASPASDVYAAGATLVSLLTGEDMGRLHDPHDKAWWRAHVQVSGELNALLSRMLDPDTESRPTAREAARTLRSLEQSSSGTSLVEQKRAMVAAPGGGDRVNRNAVEELLPRAALLPVETVRDAAQGEVEAGALFVLAILTPLLVILFWMASPLAAGLPVVLAGFFLLHWWRKRTRISDERAQRFMNNAVVTLGRVRRIEDFQHGTGIGGTVVYVFNANDTDEVVGRAGFKTRPSVVPGYPVAVGYDPDDPSINALLAIPTPSSFDGTGLPVDYRLPSEAGKVS